MRELYIISVTPICVTIPVKISGFRLISFAYKKKRRDIRERGGNSYLIPLLMRGIRELFNFRGATEKTRKLLHRVKLQRNIHLVIMWDFLQYTNCTNYEIGRAQKSSIFKMTEVQKLKVLTSKWGDKRLTYQTHLPF